MRILKPGKVVHEQYKYICPKCGCVFVAYDNELHKTIQSGSEISYFAVCPDDECRTVCRECTPYEDPENSEATSFISRAKLMGELTKADAQKRYREMTGEEVYTAVLTLVNDMPDE